MSNTNLLDVKEHTLLFKHGKQPYSILNKISFSLEKGELLGVVGESGCGKSMLGNSILGLYPSNLESTEGEILFEGTDLLKLSGKKRAKYRGKKVAMIFQNPNTSLNPVIMIGKQMTDILRRHTRVDKKTAKEVVKKYLAEVSLPDPETVFQSYPHQLSGGMKQRVVIAMALSCNAKLIVADEPTTALDVTTQYEILKLIKGLQREHDLSIILVTHDIGVASYICDRIMVMYAGKVVEIGPTKEILNHPVHPYTKGLLKCLPGGGKKVNDLYTIPGTVPSPLDFPTGCRFYTRCLNAGTKCKEETPLLESSSDNSKKWFACFYPENEVNSSESK